jgi:hypothetical protein
MNASAQPTPAAEIEPATDEFPLLGYTVIASLDAVAVRHDDLRQLLVSLGLERYLLGLPEARTALRRALRAWLTDLAGSAADRAGLGSGQDEVEVDHRTRQLIREIVAPRTPVLTLALVAENIDLSQLGLSYLTNVRVFYDRSTGQLYLTTTPIGRFDPFQLALASSARDQALLERLRPFWEYYRELHVTSDLGRMVQAIIADMDATALRPGGGVSFVPYQQRAALQRLKDLIERRLPAPPGEVNTSTLLHLPVIDRPATRAHMARVVHQALLGEVAALQKDLERFIEQAQSTTEKGRPAKVRPATIVNRLAEYRAMRAKIELYGEILGARQQQALQALGQLQHTARTLLDTAAGAQAEIEELPEAAGGQAEQLEVVAAGASR